jgi:FkbM family methyltransferase
MIKRKLRKLFYILKGDGKHLFKNLIKIKKRWYGNEYGGFFAAPLFIDDKSIIYSFGIGEDISFDLEIIKSHNSRVFGFDPTPKSVQWIAKQNLTKNFQFFAYGIAASTGLTDFFLPKNENNVSGSFVNQINVNPDSKIQVQMKTFFDLTKELGHNHINIIKMDIEGAEYMVLENLLNSGIYIDQILIEFHDRFFPNGKEMTIKSLKLLEEKGFLLFGISDSFEELSFINKSLL